MGSNFFDEVKRPECAPILFCKTLSQLHARQPIPVHCTLHEFDYQNHDAGILPDIKQDTSAMHLHCGTNSYNARMVQPMRHEMTLTDGWNLQIACLCNLCKIWLANYCRDGVGVQGFLLPHTTELVW